MFEEYQNTSGQISGHDYVDLGLPSGKALGVDVETISKATGLTKDEIESLLWLPSTRTRPTARTK